MNVLPLPTLLATLLNNLALDSATFTGSSLWALGLFLGFSPLQTRLVDHLSHRLHSVDRPDRSAAENSTQSEPSTEIPDRAVLLAQLISVIIFLGLGILSDVFLEISLGGSWAISLGILSCIGCGVYELGRRSTTR